MAIVPKQCAVGSAPRKNEQTSYRSACRAGSVGAPLPIERKVHSRIVTGDMSASLPPFLVEIPLRPSIDFYSSKDHPQHGCAAIISFVNHNLSEGNFQLGPS